MIVRLSGQLVEKTDNSVVMNVNGVYYEVMIPVALLQRVEEQAGDKGNIDLIVYHYFQIGPSSGAPFLVGFFNKIERDFFLKFITVSGIGPRAAVRALNKPISAIAEAINEGDLGFLKTLPGIGSQKAKEIIAKLQGKVGMYGLIQDRHATRKSAASEIKVAAGWQEEALDVLLQLQYKRPEASEMIQKAMERSSGISSTEELLNEIYKQRIKQ